MNWIFDTEHTNCWTCENCGFYLDGMDEPDYPPNEFGYLFCPQCGERLAEVDK